MAESDPTSTPGSAPPEPGREEYRALQAAAFDRIGERYDEAFPHKEGQERAGARLLRRLPPGAPVLDAGCGTGLPTARQLADAGMAVTGIDISPVMLDLARKNVPGARFLEADLLDPGDALRDGPGDAIGSFDAAVAFFSLLMLPRRDIATALRRLHALLVPGGLLCLSMVEIDMDDVGFQFLGAPVRVTGYLRDDLRAVVEDAGFEVLGTDTISYAPATTQAPPEVQLFLDCRRRGG
ncbi:methyltransferase [Planomonospora parontospora subsp. parontospora]|uniref:Methyltransferase n=2 Tax=Planomonospora parontospora TaxID=58119 RepID=A0AA37BNC0_9ACTN|nr:class I SAM-dependent methyltransferase [Planomonospora parontospora]GGK96567.1 methyltransferase [Planomonospora parontospora]GII12774.1 methyltransferase [Planomonospora parontospora subsp. parontospora]